MHGVDRRRLRALLLLTSVATFEIASAVQDDFAAWQRSRLQRFAEFRTAHPAQEKDISDLKLATANLVARRRSDRNTADTLIVWKTSDQPVVLFDDPFAPRMVIVPAGELRRESASSQGSERSKTSRWIRILHPFAVSMFPIVYGEYAKFIAETNYRSNIRCANASETASTAAVAPVRDWHDPGFSQSMTSPATCIGFADAQAYAAWISMKTGQHYRLLSAGEYEFAARGGDGVPPAPRVPCSNWKVAPSAKSQMAANAEPCTDSFPFTSPVNTFKPNAFGLYDMTGNVLSWTSDCWPTHGHAKLQDCSYRVLSGGSWATAAADAASHWRGSVTRASNDIGFRLARDL